MAIACKENVVGDSIIIEMLEGAVAVRNVTLRVVSVSNIQTT